MIKTKENVSRVNETKKRENCCNPKKINSYATLDRLEGKMIGGLVASMIAEEIYVYVSTL